ncbi:MAG: carbamoyl-phosphate synthase large subunit, partial [Euryarchaeota archaeon]|nr:carbamoyl-phosphate synthase large subunit [Euryarchaeota archaeon]
IGQGVEFDYSCVHAVQQLRAAGIEAVIINNNPETVSTDYDTSDRLYFEPLTWENVLDIIEREEPDGLLVQFGGQTAINLALPLKEALEKRPHLKTKIWGTPPEAIDLAENRDRFNELCKQIKVPKPEAGIAHNADEARAVAKRIGYPVLCRPSYVLGGRAMQVVGSDAELEEYVHEAVKVSKDQPLLIDDFISNAIEVDVDAVCDGDDVYMYCFEANPRSSRTVPFVAKATGVPLARIATRVAIGEKLRSMNLPTARGKHYAVKAPVFPFLKLQGVDAVLGPEMKSTGEVIGIDDDYGRAYYKAMEAAGNRLPASGSVFLSVRDEDKRRILPIASELVELGFKLYGTRGTTQYLREFQVPAEMVYKVGEKGSPDAIDLMRRGAIQLIINTPGDTLEAPARRDGYMMRRVATDLQISFLATIEAARAAVGAITALKQGAVVIKSLQEYHMTDHTTSATLPRGR